jgi:hypothetical protein
VLRCTHNRSEPIRTKQLLGCKRNCWVGQTGHFLDGCSTYRQPQLPQMTWHVWQGAEIGQMEGWVAAWVAARMMAWAASACLVVAAWGVAKLLAAAACLVVAAWEVAKLLAGVLVGLVGAGEEMARGAGSLAEVGGRGQWGRGRRWQGGRGSWRRRSAKQIGQQLRSAWWGPHEFCRASSLWRKVHWPSTTPVCTSAKGPAVHNPSLQCRACSALQLRPCCSRKWWRWAGG